MSLIDRLASPLDPGAMMEELAAQRAKREAEERARIEFQQQQAAREDIMRGYQQLTAPQMQTPQPQQQAPATIPGMNAGGRMPSGLQVDPSVLQAPRVQRPMAQRNAIPESGFKTLEGYTWAQQQQDRQRKIIDGQANKYLDIVSKAQETNPQLANKIGAQLKSLPGWELVGAAIEQTEFGVPNQKIVFGSQISKLPPAEKAALGELSPEMLNNVEPTDIFKLKRTGNAYALVEYKPDARENKRIVKTEMVDGKPTNVLYDRNGNKLNTLGEAASISAGGMGMTGFIQHKTIPGAFFSRKDGKTYVDTPEGRVPLDTLSVQQQASYWTPQMKKLAQQGGTQAVSSYVTADTYRAEAEELLNLQAKIQEQDKARLMKFKSSFKSINQLSQWAEMSTADNPELAEYLKGTKLLADLLQKAVGGAQGGQWAFELASSLLDPSMPPEAYKATIEKHQRTLDLKAKNFGKVGTNPKSVSYSEKPLLPGETAPESKRKTKDQIIADFMRVNPKATRDNIMKSKAYADAVRKYGAQ